MKKTIGLIAILIFGLQFYGCSTMSVGDVTATGDYLYKDGWLQQTYQAGLNDTYDACMKTAEQMGMRVESESLTAMTGKIKAAKGSQAYWFELREKPMNMTTLAIKAGSQGSRDQAEAIHDAVVARL